MSHRSRSRTAEDGKKPRRLTEKIAIMKKREHEQLEAFEHAMQSIHEMQRARIHSGGGSMPSLQAIDSTPPGPGPSIDMQMVFQDYNEVTRGGTKSFSNSKDRPQSGGPSGRRGPIIKTSSSMDTDPYPTSSLNHSDYCYPGEWTEGDLSRHKSDSDLQQSLLMQQGSPQHMVHSSAQQQPRNHKLNPPGDLGMWRRTNSASTAHALLSPDQYVGSPELPVPSPLGAGGTASSLPDLTNIEFSSGLEVPLEKDEPPPLNPHFHQQQQQALLQHQQQQQQQQQQQCGRFFSPPSGSGPGPSNLLYTSLPANSMAFPPPPPPAHSSFNLMHSMPPGYPGAGFQFPIMSPGAHQPGLRGLRQMNPPLGAVQGGGRPHIGKSPTMPDFRTLHAIPPQPNPALPNDQPFTRLKPILPTSLPSGTLPATYNGSILGGLLDPFMVGDRGQRNPTPGILPPMTIIIQPPNVQPATVAATTTATTEGHLDNIKQQQQQQQKQALEAAHLQQQKQQQLQQQQPTDHVTQPPLSLSSIPPAINHSSQATSYLDSPLSEMPGSKLPTLPTSFHMGNSLPNTPTITISPGLPVLPSYIEAKQQQSLQQKFASINVGKNEALIRSHSEENLQKMQKEKSELIQQNPFMGTLTNANSVPCVYVESQNMDQQLDGPDSPTNLDSPSTSASYASSPPSVRPFWLDHPNSLNEFVFHEWPPLESASLNGAGGIRPGSPPHHHRSLTDLMQNPIPELHELDRNRMPAHQLSLPSVAMTDLTMEEHSDSRHPPDSPSEFLIQPSADFDMEDSVMELIKTDVPDLNSFDMAHMLNSGSGGLISHSDSLLASQLASQDSFRAS